MTEKANFQWQNEHLLHTIYPLREMKLRDFLVYYHEFEVWEAYRDKAMDSPQVLADVRALEKSRQEENRKIHAEYNSQLEFFLGLELDYGQCDKDIPIMDRYTLKVIAERRGFQKNFLNYNSTRKQGFFLDGFILRLEGSQTILKNEMERLKRNLRNFRATDPENRKIAEWDRELQIHENTEKLVSAELDHLYRFYGYFNKIKTDLQLILDAVHGRAVRDARNAAALKRHDPEAVLEFLETRRPETPIQRKDLVLWKVEAYKRSLEEKGQEDLLRLIVDRFLDEPTRFPLWLQYMVVHFSGMRYKSAHGSWGDPKDILISLKIKSIHDKLKSDSEDILRAEAIFEAGILRSLPDADSRDMQRQIAGLESDNLYVQRATLQEVWTEKKQLAIEAMSEDQVLKELEDLSHLLPRWMWKEIVARTDLRLAHAGKNWEELTEDDKEGYYERSNAEFREILNRWKTQNLTMWREEHDRANRLIVTRAVCNEVAEHIQHLRGVSPPGGLTAKPLWYRNEERAARNADGANRPFFRKIRRASDFEPGASILWLRWVYGKPNIWRITRPIEMESGEGLLPTGLLKTHGVRELRGQKRVLKDGGKVSWVHEQEGNAFKRSRYSASLEPKPKNPKMKRWVVSDEPEVQWLRWMHEATVVATGETAEGSVVLTFETALPYEDPRRSTIGVFKRYASHLFYNVNEDFLNGTFIGYVPAGRFPLEDLKVMLDWRKIVPDMLLAQDRIDRYWQAVEAALAAPDSVDGGEEAQPLPAAGPSMWVESAPPFETRKDEAILCYRLVPDRRRPGKFQDEVVRPRIEIRRGLHFEVSEQDRKVAGSDTYLRVVRCAAEPNAVGKFVRAAEVLELPQNKRSMPVSVAGRVNIRSVNKVNARGKPVLLPSGIKLAEDTMLRVSVVHHKVSDSEQGPGQIDTDGREHYYLIVECPSRPVAEGLFITVGEVEPVSEEDYEEGKLSGAPGLKPGAPVRALVVPEDGGEEALLFKTKDGSDPESPDFDRVWQSLPKGDEIEIGEIVLTKGGKVFYPILKYEKDPSLQAFHIRRKEIEILPAGASGGGS